MILWPLVIGVHALSSWWLAGRDRYWEAARVFVTHSRPTPLFIWIIFPRHVYYVVTWELQVRIWTLLGEKKHWRSFHSSCKCPRKAVHSSFTCTRNLMWTNSSEIQKSEQPWLPIQQPFIQKLERDQFRCGILYFQPHALPSARKTHCTLVSYKSLQSGTWSHCISQIASVSQKDTTTFWDTKNLWDGNWLQKGAGMVKLISCMLFVNPPHLWVQILENHGTSWGSTAHLAGCVLSLAVQRCHVAAAASSVSVLWTHLLLCLAGWGWNSELSFAS